MKGLLTSCLLLLFAACSKNNSENKTIGSIFDSTTYEKNVIIHNPKQTDTIGSIHFSWKVPKNKQLQRDLVQFISDSTFDDFEKYSKVQIDSLDKNYRKQLNDWLSESDSSEIPASFSFVADRSFYPESENKDYLVMNFATYDYLGGAHGGASEIFFTYRKRDNRWLFIRDILDLTHEKEINRILNNEVRSKHKLNATQSLMDAEDACFIVDSIAYTSNITIDEKGITFHYGQYEVQCYAGGYYELFVPYEKLKLYLIKDFNY